MAKTKMRQTRFIILTGPYGSGKTIMMASYYPQNNPNPKRVVMDGEARVLEYNSEFHGEKGDHPDKLLFSFDLWPDELGEYTLTQFYEMMNSIQLGNFDYDVFCIDNWWMFQENLYTWTQDKQGAEKLVELFGLKRKYNNFLNTRFNGYDPAYWNMLKEIGRQFIMTLKRAKIDLVVTTEQQNVWENYGVKGRGPDGKPLMRILGQKAKAWDVAFKMADLVWSLDRMTDQLQAKPVVQLDPFAPKCSIVGLPPKFQFKSWDDIWEIASKRGVPTTDELSEIGRPEVQYGDPEGTDEPETENEGKQRLLTELSEWYKSGPEVASALKKLKLTYTLYDHDQIREALIEEATKGE